jgi:hypothetical protein
MFSMQMAAGEVAEAADRHSGFYVFFTFFAMLFLVSFLDFGVKARLP